MKANMMMLDYKGGRGSQESEKNDYEISEYS